MAFQIQAWFNREINKITQLQWRLLLKNLLSFNLNHDYSISLFYILSNVSNFFWS